MTPGSGRSGAGGGRALLSLPVPVVIAGERQRHAPAAEGQEVADAAQDLLRVRGQIFDADAVAGRWVRLFEFQLFGRVRGPVAGQRRRRACRVG